MHCRYFARTLQLLYCDGYLIYMVSVDIDRQYVPIDQLLVG